ncbi:seryl-tRNA synthetase [Macrolepiota fuliginosa MF-IS2]|uniref:serine--tRNA ligase n=1 Tax=Macrolepiota fuliginosa MF-IS2 TaxID=1400762 RepID=A0A9P5XMD3_9AGAR|nr:seryl-tRNA synthetase [Macrolepiota fuliginosa MF-IS2]
MQSGFWQKSCLRYCSRISFQLALRTSVVRSRTRPYSTSPLPDHDHDNPILTNSELLKPKLNYGTLTQHLSAKITNARARKAPIDVEAVSSLATIYAQYKDLLRTINSIRQEQNSLGPEIQRAAKAKDVPKRNELLERAKTLKANLSNEEKKLDILEHQLLALSLTFPNDTHPESPPGPEPNAKTLSTHGPPPLPGSPTRDHLSICKKFDLLDFESGSVVTGSSWYYLLNEAALLEMALVKYALNIAVESGFTPVVTPDVVRADIAARCGFQPREPGGAASQMYHIANHHHIPPPSSSQTTTSTPTHPPAPELVLAGTAEIPLAGMFVNKIYPSDQLPLKVVGVGHAFRSEAGASAESRGLYRVHQFTKVELFAVTAEDQSESMMESVKDIQKRILEGLGLSFRILDMPSEELGASAYRKYDMEAWMPGRQTWGEISSLSNCTDYQARRLHIRYRPLTPKGSTPSENKKAQSGVLPFAHTLNGTAAAIPRLIVALLENGAVLSESGEVRYIRLPKVLKPFWIDNKRSVVKWEGEE